MFLRFGHTNTRPLKNVDEIYWAYYHPYCSNMLNAFKAQVDGHQVFILGVKDSKPLGRTNSNNFYDGLVFSI